MELDYDFETVAYHTEKKFNLISNYVSEWVEKLMNYNQCEGIIFIDCMSNCGIYQNQNGEQIEGTAIRVMKIICNAMQKYPDKQAVMVFNDLDESKINTLKRRIPDHGKNVLVKTYNEDRDDLLRWITVNILPEYQNVHTLLLYDPYDAHINWPVISPFINRWGEVIINHMVSDPVRAINVVKSEQKIADYEMTYQLTIDEIMQFGSDRAAYESRVESVIRESNKRSNEKIASFPFFNNRNALVYDLIFITHNQTGFEVMKRQAWKAFGDQSSCKRIKQGPKQFSLFENIEANEDELNIDPDCSTVVDIAKYLNFKFKGRSNVPISEVFGLLEDHPRFPSTGYRFEIKNELKNYHRATIHKSTIDFS